MSPTRSSAAARSPRASTRRCARIAGSPIRSAPASCPTTMPAPSSPRPRSTRRTPSSAVADHARRDQALRHRRADRGGARRGQGLSWSAISRCASIRRRRSPATCCSFQLDNLGIDYIDRRNDLIRAVTIEDVRRVAQRLWSGKLSRGDGRSGRVLRRSPLALSPRRGQAVTAFLHAPSRPPGLRSGRLSGHDNDEMAGSPVGGLHEDQGCMPGCAFCPVGASLAAAGPVVDAADEAEALNARARRSRRSSPRRGGRHDLARGAARLPQGRAGRIRRRLRHLRGTRRQDLPARREDDDLCRAGRLRLRRGRAASTIAFKADLAIENTTGQVLGEAKDIFSLSTPSQRRTSANSA